MILKALFLLLCLIILSSIASAQTRVQLSCNILSLAGETQECVGGGFPFSIPANKFLCVTDMLLINKYPWNPPIYGGDMHSMYYMVVGFTVPAHHPHFSLLTPIAYPPGGNYRAWISNGMTESQYVYAYTLGYLADNANCER